MQNSLDYNKFFADLKIAEQLKVEEDLGSGYVKLKISESERRQALQDIKCVEDIVVELLRNSRDAGSKNIFIATKKTAEKKRLIYCIDDGRGIPKKFHNLIFQSRVTSKLEDGGRDSYGFHGRGMALFSIKLNVEDIRITYSDIKKGTCLLVDVDLEKIPEKKDQSALPGIIKTKDGYELAGGVNNIIRVLLEFALQNTGINFYYGSPTQIIATAIYLYKNSLQAGLPQTDINSIPLQTDVNNKLPQAVINNKPLQTDKNSIPLQTDINIKQLQTEINSKPPNTEINKIKNFKDFDSNILGSDVNITGFGYYADNYIVLEQVLKQFYAMDISTRGVQRLIYGEITPLKPLDESMCACVRQEPAGSLTYKKGIGWEGDGINGTAGGFGGTGSGKDDFNGSSSGPRQPDGNNISNGSNSIFAEASGSNGKTDLSLTGAAEKNKGSNKDIRLYDELKLANRFKDEEIKYIINILEKEIINIGRRHFITLENNIEFKRINNVINFIVNLKQKD